MNKAFLVGRLTRDPELKTISSGFVCTFTLAINRSYTNSSGEREADFINCVAFNKTAENINRFMRKGSMLGVDGRIQVRNYTDQQGVRRYITEVICETAHFLESKGGSNNTQSNQYDFTPYDTPKQNPYQNSYQNQAPNYPTPKPQVKEENNFEDIIDKYGITDDDLPF